ncbi:MAG TPA: LytR C-terminal domain-containing protein [Actinomycetota bacterium]|nr:LytR C-terminal domain-containing protein [Actinomycetota bacterium]
MGKHSLPGSGLFVRSVVASILRWVAIIAAPLLIGAAVWLFVVQPRTSDEPGSTATDTPTASEAPLLSPSPLPLGEAQATTTATVAPAPDPSPLPGKIQVLNGTKKADVEGVAATRLKDRGYQVTFTGKAAKSYAVTTVFYQEGHIDLANQVAQVLGAREVKPAPETLDKSIPVTAVVGDDFQP